MFLTGKIPSKTMGYGYGTCKVSFFHTIFSTLDADLEFLDLLVGLLALLLRHSGAHHQLYSLFNSRGGQNQSFYF
jgi:hypothetical protein